jgi:hypothetical protein
MTVAAIGVLELFHKRCGRYLAFWPNGQIHGVQTDSETALNTFPGEHQHWYVPNAASFRYLLIALL